MNNEQSPLSQPTGDINAWFQDVGEVKESTTHGPGHRKGLVIALTVILVFAAGFGIYSYASYMSRGLCLTIKDYADLSTDQPSQPFDSTIDFYTANFTFDPGSVNYDQDSAAELNALIQSLAQFYEKHSKQPMTFSLIAGIDSEANTSTTDLPYQRLKKVRDSLISAGIPADMITTPGTDIQTLKDGGVTDEEAADSTDMVLLSITSNQGCR